jgi:hypothetical protein
MGHRGTDEVVVPLPQFRDAPDRDDAARAELLLVDQHHQIGAPGEHRGLGVGGDGGQGLVEIAGEDGLHG